MFCLKICNFKDTASEEILLLVFFFQYKVVKNFPFFNATTFVFLPTEVGRQKMRGRRIFKLA